MNDSIATSFHHLENLRPLDHYLTPEISKFFQRTPVINILFLCEGLSFSSSNGFSFQLVIDALRENTPVSYANFKLTLASWANNPASSVGKNAGPGNYQATYTNYRFSSNDPDDNGLILDKFDEVWLFGISPNTNFPVAAESILNSKADSTAKCITV